jgi:hypothetical protein
MSKIEFDEECSACEGTGLYIGSAEKDGAAVVCYKCNGSGKFHFEHEYKEFSVIKYNPRVKRVFEVNPGIYIGENNDCKLEDFGGVLYSDWEEGGPFPNKREMRKYVCPAWWYQTANYKLKPIWDDCICCGSFKSCVRFPNKEICWKRFDEEHQNDS